MAEFWNLAFFNLAIISAAATVAWIVSLMLRNASIVDPLWGPGFAFLAWITVWRVQPETWVGWMAVTLITVWGARLGLFLLLRNAGHGEDFRYAAMRKKHGSRFWIVSLFTVFFLQALLMWFISLPVQFAITGGMHETRDPSLSLSQVSIAIAGTIIWAIGFAFESIGDWQMSVFKSNPSNRGKVMSRGLWHYTRHPNYFGDFCVWWGLFAIATAVGGWWTIASPAVMSWLLLKVSGVSLLEKDIAQRRPGYEEYQRRTNAFFPWWPRNK